VTRSATDELNDLVAERVAAVKARDGATLMARQHPDVLTYGLLGELQTTGNDAVAEQLNAWFDGYRDGPHYAVHHLRVDSDGDLGFCAYVYQVTGVLNDGAPISMAVRATLVCKRVEGRWLIVHDHESVPFDVETGLAFTDLLATG